MWAEERSNTLLGNDAADGVCGLKRGNLEGLATFYRFRL